MAVREPVRVLEFYSGIGGMNLAMRGSAYLEIIIDY